MFVHLFYTRLTADGGVLVQKVNAAKDRNAASAGGPVHRGNKAARKAAKKRNRRR